MVFKRGHKINVGKKFPKELYPSKGFRKKYHSQKIKRRISLSQKGEKNSKWKGNKVGYRALHAWIKRNKPKSKSCEVCKKKKPYDLANISGKYKRDINDFKWLCRGCHMIEDGRINNLKQFKNCGEVIR